jgi:hypothetical protein
VGSNPTWRPNYKDGFSKKQSILTLKEKTITILTFLRSNMAGLQFLLFYIGILLFARLGVELTRFMERTVSRYRKK